MLPSSTRAIIGVFAGAFLAPPAIAGVITTGQDLFVGPLEVTQGIQNFANDVRLVESKRTFVRFHVAATGAPAPANRINGVKAVLLVQRLAPGPATFLGILQPINPGGAIAVKEAPSRAGHDDSFLFELSPGWRTGTLRITGLVDPLDKVSESNESNNSAQVEVDFISAPPVRVRLYNVSYPGGDLPSEDDHTLFRSWMRSAYPATALLVQEQTLSTGIDWTNDRCNCPKNASGNCTADDFCANDPIWPCDSDGDCGCGRLNNQLVGIRSLEEIFNPGSVDADRRYVAWVDESPGFMRGCSPGSVLKVASGPTGTKNWGWDNDGSYADWYTGHELGHAYGRPHAPCCDASGSAFFPYPMCMLSDGAQSSFWGYDASTDAVVNATTFTDVMSYCDFQWPSDFTYEAILDQLILEGGAPPAPPPTGPGDFVLLTGTGNVSRGTVAIRTAMLLRGVLNPFPPPPSIGTHTVQLRDASGGVLASHVIQMHAYENDLDLYPPDVTETGGTDIPGAFKAFFPFAPGTLEIVILDGATEVAGLQVSNNPPVVNITTPNGGESIGTMTTVTWTMSDLDGDTLSSDVFYSADGGVTWKMVASSVAGTSAPVDLQGLPGGSMALFRVVTSDGFLTAVDDSDAVLSVAGQSPTVEILAPNDGASYPNPNAVSFEAQADDPEDGPLTGAAIVWTSSLTGFLGTGEILPDRPLPPGSHVITATATDSDGNSASASIRVSVAAIHAAPAASPIVLALAVALLAAIAWRGMRGSRPSR